MPILWTIKVLTITMKKNLIKKLEEYVATMNFVVLSHANYAL